MEFEPLPCQTPVLFLVYRRPELTAQVFAAIRAARPARLLVAADGAHPARPEEAAKCRAVRDLILNGIDWPCEVATRFSDRHQGCKQGVVAAIDWGFQNHERLIILEDDCLPDPTFFPFCDELLERYANDPKIMQITGSNLIGYRPGEGSSYYASRFGMIWGWATWRRAWKLYDANMTRWPEVRRSGAWKTLCRFPNEYARCCKIYDDVRSGRVDTWDCQWGFARQLHGGISIVPEFHLVANIGFGNDATHTLSANDPRAHLATQPLAFPLRHPSHLDVHHSADLIHFTRYCTELPFLGRLVRKAKKIWNRSQR